MSILQLLQDPALSPLCSGGHQATTESSQTPRFLVSNQPRHHEPPQWMPMALSVLRLGQLLYELSRRLLDL